MLPEYIQDDSIEILDETLTKVINLAKKHRLDYKNPQILSLLLNLGGSIDTALGAFGQASGNQGCDCEEGGDCCGGITIKEIQE